MTWPRFFNFLFMVALVAAGISACDSKKTPDAPVTRPYVVNGTLTYTGSLAAVSNSNHVEVVLKSTPDLNPGSDDLFVHSATNGVTYTLYPYNIGTYYLVAFMGALNEPCLPTVAGNAPTPLQGDPYYFYNGGSCGTATPLTITAGQPSASITISFDDTCLLNGVSGTVSYTGSHSVSGNNGIVVILYQDSAYTNRDTLSYNYLSCNNTTYNVGTNSGSTMYLMTFLDLAGTGLPATGDPYVKFGAITPSPTLNQNLTFSDSNLL